MSTEESGAAAEIDAIIANAGDWRGPLLAELRSVILSAEPDVVEAIKWRKPSRPEGVATWMCEGNLCVADLLKRAVRLTFPKGAKLDDPTALFNARTDSATVRAIDFPEHARVDADGLRGLVRAAIAANREG
ncbi:MAG: DUF1801 domain-containing protein [Amnibacterium sp.]